MRAIKDTPKMDPDEKSVLRRKKNLLVYKVEVDEEFVDALLEEKAITTDMVKVLERLPSSTSKAQKLVDMLIQGNPHTFNRLCAALDRKYPILADELRLDLQAERKTLEIDEIIQEESGLAVHREFGKLKRFSEEEKKNVQNMIARKVQVTQSIWRSRYDQIKIDLDKQIQLNASRERRVRTLAENIDHYLEHKGYQVKEIKNGQIPEGKDRTQGKRVTKVTPLQMLEEKVSALIDFTAKNIEDKNALADEKESTLKVLKKSNRSVKLANVVKTVMDEMKQSVDEVNQEKQEKTHEIVELQQDLQLTAEQAKKDIQIRNEEIDHLEREITMLRKKIEVIQDKARQDLEGKDQEIEILQKKSQMDLDRMQDELNFVRMEAEKDIASAKRKADAEVARKCDEIATLRREYDLAIELVRDEFRTYREIRTESAWQGLNEQLKSAEETLSKHQRKIEILKRSRRIGYVTEKDAAVLESIHKSQVSSVHSGTSALSRQSDFSRDNSPDKMLRVTHRLGKHREALPSIKPRKYHSAGEETSSSADSTGDANRYEDQALIPLSEIISAREKRTEDTPSQPSEPLGQRDRPRISGTS